MKLSVIITGATGMVGKGVLLECLDHADVEKVLVINRRSLDMDHPKLKELVRKDFYNLEDIKDQLAGYNTCFFCLGVSAFRMSEEDYTKITYELTTEFARTVLELNPDMTFCYVSGEGTDSTESSKMMWARVKGKTENTLLDMPFKAVYMFRPGVILPKKGIKSSTPMYNTMYTIMGPLLKLIRAVSPDRITDTEMVGRAMINTALKGYDKKHLANKDINSVARI
jgi:hypothetical protein